MTLFIEHTQPDGTVTAHAEVLLNLRQLASQPFRCSAPDLENPQGAVQAGDAASGQVTLKNVPENPRLREVVYTPPSPEILNASAIQSTLDFLANQTNEIIIITGFESAPELEDVAGATIVETAPDGTSRLRIGYDTNGCGYLVTPDSTQRNTYDRIPHPNLFILGHELGKATLIIQDGLPAPAAGQPPSRELSNRAITIENHFRAEKGCLKRFFSFEPVEKESCGCFIVSAASGSSKSTQVSYFKSIRDKYVRSTRLGEALFTRLFAEYAAISPGIVRDIEASVELKNWMNVLVVHPLLFCCWLLEHSAQREDQRPTGIPLDQGLPTALPGSELALAERETIARAFARVEEGMSEGVLTRRPPRRGGSQPSEPYTMRSTLKYLQAALVNARQTTYLRWAIVAPLRRYWAFASSRMPASPGDESSLEQLQESLQRWCVSFPLGEISAKLSPAALERDLAFLAASVITLPAVRFMLGRRLIRCVQETGHSDLAPLLVRCGYLPANEPCLLTGPTTNGEH